MYAYIIYIFYAFKVTSVSIFIVDNCHSPSALIQKLDALKLTKTQKGGAKSITLMKCVYLANIQEDLDR